jgi:exopolysaccharide production protein ExoQ
VTLYASLCLWALISNKIYAFYVSVSTSIVMAVLLIVDSDLLFGALGRTSDLTGRTVLWEHWPGFFYDRLLTGYGYSGFFVPGGPAERLWALDDFQTPNFHNAFLDVGIQAGLLGLLSLLLIVLIGIVRTCTEAYTSRRPFAVIFFALYLDLWLFGSGEGILITHNNFVTICAFTIYFRTGIELRSRATSRFFAAFDKRHGPVAALSE